jgi:hypothetical protein
MPLKEVFALEKFPSWRKNFEATHKIFSEQSWEFFRDGKNLGEEI